MDFKVAGTNSGITGLQMDIKITGITREIMGQALEQARQARLSILEAMNGAIAAARSNISQYAPRIITITINKDKIRDVIGPGGKMIRSITERTGCKIEIHDDGRVDIASTDEAAAQQAVDIVRELTAEAELGKTYVGRVVRVVNFGAFVEILPGVEGLLHISEIADRRIGEVRDVLDEGDETMVKVIDIDGQGRVRLSRRAAMQEEGDDSDEEQRSGGDRNRGDSRGGSRRGGRGGERGGRSGEPVGVGNRGGERGRSGHPPRRGGGRGSSGRGGGPGGERSR
jgi:polyribonucleotide nucleotidyltransferase